MGGVIIDFVLAPANTPDLEAGLDMLFEHTDLNVIGDKAYISAEVVAELWRTNRLRLQTLPRKNQKEQLPKSTRRLVNAVRQIIETVNGQLEAQFNIENQPCSYILGSMCQIVLKADSTYSLYLHQSLTGED